MASDFAPTVSLASEPVVMIRRNGALYSAFALVLGVFVLWIGYSEYWQPGGGFVLSSRWPRYAVLGAIFIGAIWFAVDRRPVLILDAQGLRDRRQGSALLPWSDMTRAEAIYFQRLWGRQMGVRLHFRKNVPIRIFCRWSPVTTVYIATRRLNVEPVQLVEYLKRFAPHVAVDETQLEIRLTLTCPDTKTRSQ